VQTAVHVITTGALIALLTGIAMKLRWFGPNWGLPRRPWPDDLHRQLGARTTSRAQSRWRRRAILRRRAGEGTPSPKPLGRDC